MRQIFLALGIASMVATVHGAWFAAPDAGASAPAAIARVRFSVWDHAQGAWSSRYLANGETILGAEGDIIELKPEVAGTSITALSIPSYLVSISLDAPPQSACETLDTACTIPAPNPVDVALAAAGTPFYGRLAQSQAVYAVGAPSEGQPVVEVGTPGVNELSATDQGGSVGVNAVTLNVDADAVSFTWDVSRWARGDVFVGLNYAAYKVLDRHGTFKRYLASSDYGRRDQYDGTPDYDATIGEATTGCAANWRTGEIFLTNFDDIEPAVNVVTRQPGSGVDYPYPYANQARRVSTAIFRSEDPTDGTWVYPIDTSPESIVFDGAENMYVGHSGPYYSTADYSVLDPNLNKFFDAGQGYSFVDEVGAQVVLARRLGTFVAGTAITLDPPTSSRLDTTATGEVQFNPATGYQWGIGPGESATLTLAKTVWEDAENFALENVAVPGVALAARPILGKRLHKYNYTGVASAPYSGASRDLHWPFTNRQGTDWIDLAADQRTMFYTSENTYIHRYDTVTGRQLSDFGTGQNRQLAGGGRIFHALRILPPGDGTGGVIVASGSQILRLNADGQLIQYYQADGDPDVIAHAATSVSGLVQFWYSLEVDPSGRTFWASGHDTGYLYQFDLATGAQLKRVKAVDFIPLNDPVTPFGRRVEGICIMWEYTAAQETCDDGIDNDGDGFIDESCTPIESCSVSSAGDDDGDGFVDHNDPDCGVESPPTAVDDSYVINQDAPLSVTASGVLSNDSDPDNVDADPLNNDTLTVREVGTNAGALAAGNVGTVDYPTAQGGKVTVSSDGGFSYTPAAGFHGLDTFMYRAFDGAGLSNSVTVAIRVRPLVADDSYTILQGATLSVGGTDVSPAGILVNDSAQPMQAVAATLTTSTGGAAVEIFANGNFTYQPPAAFVGVDTFVYRGQDSASESSNTATVTITVQDVNELTAADDAVDTPHGTPVTVNVKGNDRDPEDHTFGVKTVNGQAIGIGQSVAVSNATVTLGSDGRLVVTPANGYTGVVTFTYTVEDSPASPMQPVTANATVNVTVGPPSIGGTDDAYTTPQNTLLNVPQSGVLTNDVGVGPLTVYAAGVSPTLSVLASSSDGWAAFNTGDGFVRIRPDGGFTYEPQLDFIGVDHFNYTLINPQGTPSAVVTVTLTVTATSSATVATTPNPSVYGTVVPVTATIRCGANSAPSVGTVTFRDGATVLASGVAVVSGISTTTLPASVVVGNHTITAEYSGVTGVCPTAEGSTTHRVTPAVLTVTAENKSKVYGAALPALTSGITGFVAGDLATVVTGAAALATAATAATGVGSYAITAALGTLAAQNYTFTFVNATLTVTPAVLTVTADNKTRAYGAANPTLTSTFSGFVNGDDADVVTGAAALSTAAATASPVGSYAIAATAGTLTADNYTFTPVDGVLTVTPAVLTVRADDKSRNYGAPNPALTASITGFAAGDTAAVVTGEAALGTAAVPTSPAGPYTITAGQGTLATTPNYTFVFVNGTLTVVNNLPVAVNDTFDVPEDSSEMLGNLGGNDSQSADGGNVWSLVTGASHGTVQVAVDGWFLYNPAADYHGTDSFTYRLTDANGDVSTATVTVTITPVDDLPVAGDDAFTTDEDTAVTGSLTGNDTNPDGGSVWSLATGAGHGTVAVAADGTFSYTPAANFHGTDTFTYTLTDADGDVATATVTVTVTSVDDLPVAVDDAVTTNEDTEASGSLTANDATSGDGGNVWSLAAGASHGTAVVHADGTYSYMPAANFHGTDTFTYTLADADGDVSTATVTVTIASVDDLPVAVDDAVSTNEDTPMSGNLALNDTESGDGGNVWSLATGAGHGTVQVAADGTFTYTPAADYNGTDSFTYTLTDADGDVSTATVTIAIAAVNLPTAVNDTVTTTEDTAVSGDLAANDRPSADGGNVWSLETDPSHGTVVVQPGGAFTYTPEANYNGTDSFTYTLTDLNGDVSMATVTVTITGVDDLPVAVDDAVTTVEDTAVSGSLTGNDTPSGDGGNVWSLVTGASHGTAVVHADGAFTYTPVANYTGTDSFTYRLRDADGDVSTATVTVTITPVNDPPVAVDDATTTTGQVPVSISVLANDTDPDGDTLTVLSFTQPTGGTVTASGGVLIFVANPGFAGPATFTYTIVDAAGVTSTATVVVTVGVVGGNYRTQTQGGWGSAPSGDNPGAFLAANFEQVFTAGYVQVGAGACEDDGDDEEEEDCGYWLRFTSASNVERFLPQGGKARKLKANGQDVTKSAAGVFAGQVLALQISVSFSNAGVTRFGLGDLTVQSGKLEGWTVAEVLAAANKALGGGSLPSDVSISDLNTVVDRINNNFVDGTTDNGYVR